jgi:hypothetical protein
MTHDSTFGYDYTEYIHIELVRGATDKRQSAQISGRQLRWKKASGKPAHT